MPLKNLRIHIGILTLLFLRFFLMPNISYACPKNATTAEKAACSKKKSAKAEHQAGCKDKSCNKCKHGKGCGGNCKHNSCRCGASVTSLTIPTPIDLKAKYPFAAVKKQKFGFKEAYYSSGYYSIWLPPKIS